MKYVLINNKVNKLAIYLVLGLCATFFFIQSFILSTSLVTVLLAPNIWISVALLVAVGNMYSFDKNTSIWLCLLPGLVLYAVLLIRNAMLHASNISQPGHSVDWIIVSFILALYPQVIRIMMMFSVFLLFYNADQRKTLFLKIIVVIDLLASVAGGIGILTQDLYAVLDRKFAAALALGTIGSLLLSGIFLVIVFVSRDSNNINSRVMLNK